MSSINTAELDFFPFPRCQLYFSETWSNRQQKKSKLAPNAPRFFFLPAFDWSSTPKYRILRREREREASWKFAAPQILPFFLCEEISRMSNMSFWCGSSRIRKRAGCRKLRQLLTQLADSSIVCFLCTSRTLTQHLRNPPFFELCVHPFRTAFEWETASGGRRVENGKSWFHT